MLHAREDYQRIQDPDGKIPEDEPVFVIRGQDLAAQGAMLAWIAEARALGAEENIIQLVEAHMVRVAEWQRDHKYKVPDV